MVPLICSDLYKATIAGLLYIQVIITHLAMQCMAIHCGWVVDVLGKQYKVHGHLHQSTSIDQLSQRKLSQLEVVTFKQVKIMNISESK